MPLLGAHVSVAGGLPRAVERAIVHQCDAFQIFAKNASQWRGRATPSAEADAFRAAVTAAGLAPVVSHASYLINLAARNPTLRTQSVAAMRDEIERARALGLFGVVLHPGSYTDGDEASGIDLIAEALLDLLGSGDGPRVLLEQTAGQGTALGATFEQLALIIAKTHHHRRIGICLDTCHLFAAGYDLRSKRGYAETVDRFNGLIGFERLQLFHLNDSKKPLGSRVDRHEHIGAGHLGLTAFRRVLNDPRFSHLPMLIETPKAGDGKPTGPIAPDRFDERNLGTLRRLTSRVRTGR
jgi:deoxyribonuclease IV